MLFLDLQGSLQQRLGLFEVPPLFMEKRQIVEIPRNGGMVFAEGLFINGERPKVELFRFLVGSSIIVNHRQITERGGGGGVGVAGNPLASGGGFPITF